MTRLEEIKFLIKSNEEKSEILNDQNKMIDELIKACESKDKQIQDMQERLDKCKEAFKDLLVTANFDRYESGLCREALEACERGEK